MGITGSSPACRPPDGHRGRRRVAACDDGHRSTRRRSAARRGLSRRDEPYQASEVFRECPARGPTVGSSTRLDPQRVDFAELGGEGAIDHVLAPTGVGAQRVGGEPIEFAVGSCAVWCSTATASSAKIS